MRILIVEDDLTISKNLRTFLERSSYVVDVARHGNEGLERALNEEYDLVILDWMLPGKNGIEICHEIRKSGKTVPVIMLTAKSQVEDKVEGLDVGADDYLTKPFEMSELLARVRALLRRKYTQHRSGVIEAANLIIDTNSHIVKRGDKILELSVREYALLEYLASNMGIAMSREDILTHVWDENIDLFTNTVDVHIRYLRKKIDVGSKKKLIKTVKGVGYMLCKD
ncbi:MAG: Two component transcriptional regulator, winged helix family [candidate division WS6 bacterium GW2011_GWF2_39_15]|uniref:Two component transcriptional regulator, winged helix family n=1 Tax=candidate division WS6 bacterium GW2011_GWF2_39_15 TaxID=1619100 RepID=A0A0G0MYU9_9BACT|nr:MAG: Two component transcriptional regulator, winged helix family [candidate division WS6 bacterium GW2011_GWF2_39_15]